MRWQPLVLGLLKLNVDAAVEDLEGYAGLGVVIKDFKGGVVGTMAIKMGVNFDPYIANCLAI